MAMVNIDPPRLNKGYMNYKQNITEIQEYLYQLIDKLKYILYHLDEENITDEFLKSAIRTAMEAETLTTKQIKCGDNRLDLENGVLYIKNNAIPLERIPFIQTGKTSISSYAWFSITFPHPYDVSPTVFAQFGTWHDTVPDGDYGMIKIRNISKTGFEMTIGAANIPSKYVEWVAFGNLRSDSE